MHQGWALSRICITGLAEIVVEIPPLRQQVSDAALLAHAFARRFAQEHGRN